MTVHAFADESRRGSTYLIAVAIAEPGNLRVLRRRLRSLLLPGQRELHFNDQKDPRRRSLSDAIARLPVKVTIYQCPIGRYVEPARQRCIDRIASDLLTRRAHRLVIDSRAQLDTHDAATIRAVLIGRRECDRFVYEHVDSVGESVLWVADAAAWCYGAGGPWRTRIEPIVCGVVNLC